MRHSPNMNDALLVEHGIDVVSALPQSAARQRFDVLKDHGSGAAEEGSSVAAMAGAFTALLLTVALVIAVVRRRAGRAAGGRALATAAAAARVEQTTGSPGPSLCDIWRVRAGSAGFLRGGGGAGAALSVTVTSVDREGLVLTADGTAAGWLAGNTARLVLAERSGPAYVFNVHLEAVDASADSTTLRALPASGTAGLLVPTEHRVQVDLPATLEVRGSRAGAARVRLTSIWLDGGLVEGAVTGEAGRLLSLKVALRDGGALLVRVELAKAASKGRAELRFVDDDLQTRVHLTELIIDVAAAAVKV